ncbi:MAG: DUF3015 domain-containing protein [Nevskiales bacterium]|nr:DUF3015 domain-containing protein [Nevskiales bacterium]
MNKKLIAVAALALAPLSSVYADNDAGCGAGTMLWKGEKGIPYHLLATYTNNLFGNQTFAISSGTWGCNGNTTITVDARVTKFASVNLDQLSAEMAAGEGETLTALASLYGIEESTDRAAFFALAQSRYTALFSSEVVTAAEVVTALRELMLQDVRLSRYAV